jgi:hypothetical protein
MTQDKWVKGLLVVVGVLLVANLIALSLNLGATPAQAQEAQKVVGMAATSNEHGVYVFRVWNTGMIECRALGTSPNSGATGF